MFQFERGVWHQIMRESIYAAGLEAFEARGGERLGRHFEGQLGENQRPQGPARHVDALPKRIGAEQDGRAGFAEAT